MLPTTLPATTAVGGEADVEAATTEAAVLVEAAEVEVDVLEPLAIGICLLVVPKVAVVGMEVELCIKVEIEVEG